MSGKKLTNEQERDLNEMIRYHAPHGDQEARYQNIRSSAEHFIRTIMENTPVSADQSAAIRKAREAMMTANASIALGPGVLS